MQNNLLVRFPPSPTGMLHIGNARVAFLNYLFAQKYGAKYIIRFDDTDTLRTKEEYKNAMIEDLQWLGIEFANEPIYQTQRTDVYQDALEKLVKTGRIYECFETKEELDVKRKVQNSRGLPLIYDRTALKITAEQKKQYINEGRVPYFRFKINNEEISWNDGVQGKIVFQGSNISDPIVTRADGSFMYAFCSIVDDFAMDVSHVIRGADHITNTAVQSQMFDALNTAFNTNKQIEFLHLPLFQAKEGKISKRVGGFAIRELASNGFEKKAILNFLVNLGKSSFTDATLPLEDLIKQFDFKNYSKATVTFTHEVLENFNTKCLNSYEFHEISQRLPSNIQKEFFDDFKGNIKKLEDINHWWNVASSKEFYHHDMKKEDGEFFIDYLDILQNNKEEDWGIQWSKSIKELKDKYPQRKGKQFFMPLRIGFSGMEHGIDLQTFTKWKLMDK